MPLPTGSGEAGGPRRGALGGSWAPNTRVSLLALRLGGDKCLLFWALSLRPPQAPGPVAEKRGAQGEFVTPREAHGRGPVAVTGRGAQGAAGKGR